MPSVPRSLLEAVDLAVVRGAAAADPGPFAVVCACLLEGGVLEHDADDPAWPDRDRVLAGVQAAACVDAAFVRNGAGPPEQALRGRPVLPVGLGAALSSALDGDVFRVWCLLGAADVHGATWDAARAAAADGIDALTVVARDPDGTLGALLSAVGWALQRVRLDDPAEVLSGMDRACARTDGPSAVLGR